MKRSKPVIIVLLILSLISGIIAISLGIGCQSLICQTSINSTLTSNNTVIIILGGIIIVAGLLTLLAWKKTSRGNIMKSKFEELIDEWISKRRSI